MHRKEDKTEIPLSSPTKPTKTSALKHALKLPVSVTTILVLQFVWKKMDFFQPVTTNLSSTIQAACLLFSDLFGGLNGHHFFLTVTGFVSNNIEKSCLKQ